jgi:hypothetical protein
MPNGRQFGGVRGLDRLVGRELGGPIGFGD